MTITVTPATLGTYSDTVTRIRQLAGKLLQDYGDLRQLAMLANLRGLIGVDGAGDPVSGFIAEIFIGENAGIDPDAFGAMFIGLAAAVDAIPNDISAAMAEYALNGM